MVTKNVIRLEACVFPRMFLSRKAQCEEHRAHDKAHDEVVNRAAGQLGRIVRDDRNDCQLGEIHRRTLAAFRQVERTVMCRGVIFLQSAVLLYEYRVIADELCGAAQQRGTRSVRR